MTLVYGMLETWSQGTNLFAKVIAEQQEDGYFTPVKDAVKQFPTTGDVCIPKDIVPERYQRYCCGTWEVYKLKEALPGSVKYCEFKAKDTYNPPSEIIQISVFSDQISLARKRLTKGVYLPFPVLANPYIEFLDGIVVGPLKIRQMEGGQGFFCDIGIFNHPLTAWTDRRIFNPIEYSKPGFLPRFFTANLEPPPSEKLIDMAPLKVALSSTLKFACKTGPGSYILSQRQRAEIIERISCLDAPEYVECRRDTTIKLLELSKETGDILDECIDVILEYPKVQEELEQLRNNVKNEALNELNNEEQSLIANISSLSQKKNDLILEIDSLESQCIQKKRDMDQINVRIENEINTRISGAFEKAESLLAEIAVIRPFLNSTMDFTDIKEISVNSSSEAPTYEEIIQILTYNLKAIGMYSSDASVLSNEIIAAIGTGQAVMFQGTMANIITKVVAWSFASNKIISLKVPIGFNSHKLVRRLIQQSDALGQVSALILEGANNSSLEAYAPDLIDLVTERALGIGKKHSHLIVLGSISNGVCSLPSDIFTYLGPIFNTDCLGWKRVKNTLDIRYAHVTNIDFVSFEKSDEEDDFYKLIDSLMGQNPNWLWKTNTCNALSILNTIDSNQLGITPMQSVFWGWVLPRCNLSNLDLTKYLELMNNGKFDSKVRDKRIIQSLKSMGLEVE